MDFEDLSSSHNTMMIYEITKFLLLTTSTDGQIKRDIINLIANIGKSKSLELIKEDFFNITVKSLN